MTEPVNESDLLKLVAVFATRQSRKLYELSVDSRCSYLDIWMAYDVA